MAAIAPFGLRMQPELKDRIESAAKANNRSMNAEIVARLESTFEDTSPILHDLGEAISKLEKTSAKYKLDVEFIRNMADQINSMGTVLRHIAEKEDGISPELKRDLQALTKKEEPHS